MNENNKKVIISLVVGITTFVLLIMGATFAYYQATNSASGSTTVDVTAEAAGNVMVTNPTENLYISLAEYEMQQSKTGTSYYATDRYNEGKTYAKAEQNHVIASTIITDAELSELYNCTFNVNITKPEGIKAGDMTLEIETLNGATINNASSIDVDLYGAESIYKVNFSSRGNLNSDLLTGDIKFNNTESEQSYLVEQMMTTNISISDLECRLDLAEEKVCLLADDSEVEEGLEGAKYNCKVDPNKPEYTFYLLDNNEDGTSDLIMNANINASGEAVIPGVTKDIGLTEWNNTGIRGGGPMTAMTYLYNATKSWTNVEPLNYEYYDLRTWCSVTTGCNESEASSYFESAYGTYPYESLKIENGILSIVDNSGNNMGYLGTSEMPVRTRLPLYSENDSLNEIKTENQYIIKHDFLSENIGPYPLKPDAYWTMTNGANRGGDTAIAVDYWSGGGGGPAIDGEFLVTDLAGVRPVITVEL